MRKFVFVLIALLFATAYAVAVQNADITVDPSDTQTGENLVEADDTKPVVVRKPITRLHLIGTGLAISEDDAFDFSYAKVVVGAVKVSKTTEGIAEEGFVTKRLGVLMLDRKRYHLKDIAVSAEEISAEIYGPTAAATSSEAIGELKVKRFERPEKDIWAGNMVLDDKPYNIYLLGVKRQFKVVEVAQKIGEYCKNHPDDARCKKLVSTCPRDADGCRNRIEEHCKNNTTDRQCLQLKKLYCLKNATDERCRNYLKSLCEKYPGLAHCRIRTVNGERIIGINSESVVDATAETGEVAENLVSTKTRPRLAVVKKKIDAVRTRALTGDE